GRIAVGCSAGVAPVAAMVDLAFPLLLLAALAREVVAGRNWRNLPMLAALGVIVAANGFTHVEALGWAATGSLGLRLGTATIVMLIGLGGGRLIPSFTRNWLSGRGGSTLPAPFGQFDTVAIAATLVTLALWVVMPDSAVVSALMA